MECLAHFRYWIFYISPSPSCEASFFFVEFHNLLDSVVTISPELFILGDFNLHLNTRFTVTSRFNDSLASCDLKQDTSFRTYTHGQWFNHLITRSTPKYMHTLTVTNVISDHFAVIAEITFRYNPVISNCNIIYRFTHSIDILTFNDDIVKYEIIINPKADLSPL